MNTINQLSKESERKNSPSVIKRFLWWCAGADSNILLKCPTDWEKFASMGATILFTGVLAALAGGYALYTVFRSGELNSDAIDTTAMWMGTGFGVLWGMIIFNLDRYIITSFKKSDSTNAFVRVWRDLMHALPRIILAVIIAITISKPIEIKIMENPIESQIKKNRDVELIANVGISQEIYDISGKESAIEKKKEDVERIQEELSTWPEYIKNMDKELQELKADRKRLADESKAEQKAMSAIWANSDNFIYKLDSLGNSVKTDKLKSAPSSQYLKHRNNKKRYDGDIKEKDKKIQKKEGEIAEEKNKYKEEKAKELNDAREQHQHAVTNLEVAASNANVHKAQSDSITSKTYRNNFAMQLEALGDLKKARIEPNDSESVISAKHKKAQTYSLISFALTLLFLSIELAPMLTKLIIHRGAYDDMYDAAEKQVRAVAAQYVGDAQSDINLSNEKNKAKEIAALEGNAKLMSRIVDVQVELLDTAIEEWRKEELTRIKADPSKYIKSNTRNE